jgi:hypothetical protein
MAGHTEYSFDLLLPFFAVGAVIILLLMVQRWIHRHLFGVGFLLARDKGTATLFYYLFLMPGVFLHEFSQYMMAGVFAVRAHKYNLVPEAQDDGSLEMGFIELEEVKNPVYAAIIGIAPLLAGIAVVLWISGKDQLNLPQIFTAIRTNDLSVIGAAFQMLVTKPDFLLWLYVLFAVSNTMMPSRDGRRGWLIVGAAVAALIVFLTVIGMEELVIEALQGWVSDALWGLTSVLGIVLALDLVVAGIIWLFEFGMQRVTGHKVEYAPALTAGNQAALSAPKGPKSVYDLRLPIPAAPGKASGKAPAKLPAAAGSGAKSPALGSGAAKPALGSGAQSPSGAKPAFGSGSQQPAGARPAFGTPNPAQPARPAFGSPAASTGGAQGSSGSAGASPARPGVPSVPGAKPATPSPAVPAKPGTISGPPALARPAAGPTPAPKPTPSATGARPSPFGRRDEDDYIDADVIDEDDEDDTDYEDDDEYVDSDDE